MSDKRHTPGPWKIGRDISFGGRFGGKTIRGSSTVAIAVFGSGRGGANARLIAAAPDLASALQGIIPAYEAALERLCELGQGFGACMSVKVLPDARAAIEQATNQEVTP